METKNDKQNSRNDKPVITQKSIDTKSKLELEKKAKLDKIIEEANKLAENQQKVYDDVEKESQKTFTDLPMTIPTQMDMQNPDYQHNLIYKQIYPLKRAFIPKGQEGQQVRDEINLFLKEGKKKGRDSRQAYIHLLVEAINTFKGWVNEFGGTQLSELYYRFYGINKELGFRKDKE